MVLSVSLSNKYLDLRDIPIPFAACLATLSIWSFQMMHSSTTTPSVLVDETRLIPSDPIIKIRPALTWDNLCHDPINTYSVLLTFKVNLLAKKPHVNFV